MGLSFNLLEPESHMLLDILINQSELGIKGGYYHTFGINQAITLGTEKLLLHFKHIRVILSAIKVKQVFAHITFR